MVDEILLATRETRFFNPDFIKQMKYIIENKLHLREKQRLAIEKVHHTFVKKKEY